MNRKDRFDVIGIGELLMKFQPTLSGEGLNRARQYEATVGGTEANVLASMMAYGSLRVGMLTVLPKNELGDFVRNELRAAGISDDLILYTDAPSRMGTYYYVPGVGSYVGDHVEYDRENSAFVTYFRRKEIAEKIPAPRLLHVSGVTLALSEEIRETVLWLVREAKAGGAEISSDYNYRMKLWGDESVATGFFEKFLPLVDYFNISAESCRRSFHLSEEQCADEEGCCRYFAERYDIGVVSLTKRQRTSWQAFALDQKKNEFAASMKYENLPVLGRIGSGDAAVGGFLGALLTGHSLQEAIELMSGFMVTKMSSHGDMLHLTNLGKVEKLINNRQSETGWELSNR